MQSYFELLGLENAFPQNEKTLETAYFTAQRACHPDRFVGKPEADRIAAITRSQLVNDAYDTLKNPLTRAEHLLLLNGYTALDDDAAPPADLLMEMMELREQLADSDTGADLARMVDDIKTRASTTSKDIEAAFDAKNYLRAAQETMRLQYLGKAMEEAHMRVYRMKAGA